MKVIRSINNNVAICLDDDGNELIAISKGIGFKPTPYEITDLNLIQKTYYNISKNYINLFQHIPTQYFEIASKIIAFAKLRLHVNLNPNVVMTLADHIMFMIERYHKKLEINYSAFFDLKYTNPDEFAVGKYGVKLINKYEGIQISEIEAYGIAFHFINAISSTNTNKGKQLSEGMLNDITDIIETHFHIMIDKDGFNYSRFVTHINYLLKRGEKDQLINTENIVLYENLIREFPDSYLCVQKIDEYFEKILKWRLNKEEVLYLILHVNRLYAHEDCNQ